MPVPPTTSEGQIRQYRKSVAQARNFATKELNPSGADYQRLFKKQRELNAGFTALVRRLMANVSDYTLARSILGGDFISPEEIMVARPDVVYSPEHIAQLASKLPSEEVLHSLKESGRGLMPQPPKALSLLDVRAAKPTNFRSETGGWYERQEFAKDDVTGTGWLAIKKESVADSTNRSWSDQNKLITLAEYVPNAAEASWFITIFFDVHGIRLFERMYVRTLSLDSDGLHVGVGDFGTGGLSVNYNWDSSRDDRLGLASAWKF